MISVFIILIVLCVALSSFFSGVEMALAKVNKTRMAREAEKGSKNAKLVCNFIDNYNDTINVILIGNNLVNIAATSLARRPKIISSASITYHLRSTFCGFAINVFI